jgi:hypothetical protein
LAAALLLAQRAIDHDRWDPWGHFVAGCVHTIARRFKPAAEELHEAIACNPSFTYAHNILALAYCYAGRPDECMAELAIAKRFNPRDGEEWALLVSFLTAGLVYSPHLRRRQPAEDWTASDRELRAAIFSLLAR